MVLENFLIDVDVLWDRAGKELYEKPEARAGRKMRVRVTNKGLVEDLTGYTLNLGWKSTIDETKFGLDAFTAVDITKGIFEIAYTSGMLTNIGTLVATLQLVPSEGAPTESNNFKITVKKSAVDAAAIQSENSFTALETALVEVTGWNARIDDVEQDFIDRANNLDATYPIELNSVKQQLEQKANIADLPSSAYTFKGSTTFAALPPTGNTLGDVRYTTDNSQNYAWTGTAWTQIGNGAFADGSVITKKIADSAVTLKKLSFNALSGYIGKNKFNKNDENIIVGKYVNYSNGVAYTNAEYSIYTMLVGSATNFMIKHCDQLAFFDVNGTFISGFSSFHTGGTKSVPVPANAYVLKASVFNTKFSVYQIEEGTVGTYYEPYKVVLPSTSLERSASQKTVQSVMAKIHTGDTIKIKLVGDSITNGVGGTGYDTLGTQIITGRYVNVGGYCWANELKAFIEEKFANVTVLNYGISGTTTTQVKNNLSAIISADDDIVVVMLGTNDRQYDGILTNTYNNLITIGDYVKNLGNEVIFMSNIPASVVNEADPLRVFHMEDVDYTVNFASQYYNQEYISVYRAFIEYCDTKGVTIDSLLADGLHPNDAGYTVMYQIISHALGFGIKRPGATW